MDGVLIANELLDDGKKKGKMKRYFLKLILKRHMTR